MNDMASVKKGSRRLVLGAAFLCVMAVSGGLLGGIGGLMLVLLTHAIFLMDEATLALIVTCGSIGVVAATLWSLVLMFGPASRNLAWQAISNKHSPEAN